MDPPPIGIIYKNIHLSKVHPFLSSRSLVLSYSYPYRVIAVAIPSNGIECQSNRVIKDLLKN